MFIARCVHSHLFTALFGLILPYFTNSKLRKSMRTFKLLLKNGEGWENKDMSACMPKMKNEYL